jgi:hypothetical protein
MHQNSTLFFFFNINISSQRMSDLEDEENSFSEVHTEPVKYIFNDEAEPFIPIIKTGYLWKKGGSRRNWKKRWFELRPHTLAYYNNRTVSQLLTSKKKIEL